MTLDDYARYLMPDGTRYKAVRAGEGLYRLYAMSATAWAAPKYELRPDGQVYCWYGRRRVCAGEELIPEAAV